MRTENVSSLMSRGASHLTCSLCQIVRNPAVISEEIGKLDRGKTVNVKGIVVPVIAAIADLNITKIDFQCPQADRRPDWSQRTTPPQVSKSAK